MIIIKYIIYLLVYLFTLPLHNKNMIEYLRLKNIKKENHKQCKTYLMTFLIFVILLFKLINVYSYFIYINLKKKENINNTSQYQIISPKIHSN